MSDYRRNLGSPAPSPEANSGKSWHPALQEEAERQDCLHGERADLSREAAGGLADQLEALGYQKVFNAIADAIGVYAGAPGAAVEISVRKFIAAIRAATPAPIGHQTRCTLAEQIEAINQRLRALATRVPSETDEIHDIIDSVRDIHLIHYHDNKR